MIKIDSWITALTRQLKITFVDRLLFTGLQGSYQRGEANEDSDIDAVVILETLSIDDLKLYKSILATMPEHEKTCGFISGIQEIRNCPKYELFQFLRDTRSVHGNLESILPPIGREDIIQSVKVGAPMCWWKNFNHLNLYGVK